MPSPALRAASLCSFIQQTRICPGVCAGILGSGGAQEAHLNDVPAPWGSLSGRGRHPGSGINKTVPGVLEAVGALEKGDGGKGDGSQQGCYIRGEGEERALGLWVKGRGLQAQDHQCKGPGAGCVLGTGAHLSGCCARSGVRREWLRGGGSPPVAPLAGDLELELFSSVK